MKVETYLPVFPGFYSTNFEIQDDHVLEDVNEIRESNGMKPVDFDELEFDYESAMDEVAKTACNFVWNELYFVNGIEFQKVVSPREYNFANDSINCENDLDFNALLEYLAKNKEAFSEYLKENHTSRSGFTSFHSNSAEVWTKEYILEKESHRVGACLDFVLRENEDVEDDMYNYCVEQGIGCRVDASNYDQLTAEISA